MLGALVIFGSLQLATDAIFFYSLLRNPVTSFGGYMILSTLTSLSYVVVVMLYTWLVLHPLKGLRWGIAVLASLLIFLGDLLVLSLPYLLYNHFGFFTAWLPYNLVFSLYALVLSIHLPQSQAPPWFRNPPTERAQLETMAVLDVRARSRLFIYIVIILGWGGSIAGYFLVTKSQLVARICTCCMGGLYRFLVPLWLYGFMIYLETHWTLERKSPGRGSRGIVEPLLVSGEEDLTEKEAEEVAKTIAEGE